jgi:GxxExxY protein
VGDFHHRDTEKKEEAQRKREFLFCEGKKEKFLPRGAAKILDLLSCVSMSDLITEKIIGSAIEVHRCLGPGLLESTYERCLAKEFNLRKIPYERQKICPLTYKGLSIDEGYRVDFLVENEVILEIKSLETMAAIHDAQVLTYLRLLQRKRGLLLNFNVPVLIAGIKRFTL